MLGPGRPERVTAQRRRPLPTGLPAEPVGQGVLDQFFAELTEQVRRAMVHWNVPGAAIALHYYGYQWTAGIGVTNVDYPLPVNEQTLFQVGGLTKLVTGLAVALLVEQGQLELDAPVRSFLPTFRVADARASEQVTLRQLLNHTAGWFGDLPPSDETGPDAIARYVDQLAGAPQLLPPGRAFSYNEAGFAVAGRVVEVRTGRFYATAMRELVFAPLGMEHASFLPREVITARHTAGHQVEGGGLRPLNPWARVGRGLDPALGLAASAADLLRLGRLLLGLPVGRFTLAPETLTLLLEPTSDAGVLGREEFAGFALATMVWQAGEERYYGQSGQSATHASRLIIHPPADFVLVLLMNSSTGDAAIAEVLPAALARYTGIVLRPPVLLTGPASQLGEYAGRYGFTDSRLGPILEISVQDGALQLERDGVVRIVPTGQDTVVLADGPQRGVRAEFLRDREGNVGWLRLDGKVYPRLR
jgi:CubicO group peptidase (beta-lactamase class C family)